MSTQAQKTHLSHIITKALTMQSPFFIVGTQRSGTTLLQQMLNSHPDCYVQNEMWPIYGFIEESDPNHSSLVQMLRDYLEIQSWQPLQDSSERLKALDCVDEAFQFKLDKESKTRWALKDPRLTYYLELFRNRYPDSRFLFIIRDARAVVNSYLTRKMNVANVYAGAKLWRDEIGLQTKFAAKHPDRCKVIRYEHLVSKTEATLRELSAFLELEFCNELMEYYNTPVLGRLHSGNENVVKPIQEEIAQKWRRSLGQSQVSVIESVAGETLCDLGYGPLPRTKPLATWRCLGYELHQKLMTTYWWQKRSGWHGLRRLIHWHARGNSKTTD